MVEIIFRLSEYQKILEQGEFSPPESWVWPDRAIFRMGLTSLLTLQACSSGDVGVGDFQAFISRFYFSESPLAPFFAFLAVSLLTLRPLFSRAFPGISLC